MTSLGILTPFTVAHALLRGDNLIAGKTIFVTTHNKRVVDLAKRTLRVRKMIP